MLRKAEYCPRLARGLVRDIIPRNGKEPQDRKNSRESSAPGAGPPTRYEIVKTNTDEAAALSAVFGRCVPRTRTAGDQELAASAEEVSILARKCKSGGILGLGGA